QHRLRLLGLALASLLVVALQIAIFDIHWTMALVAVPFAFLLAAVAARVAGETGIPPIGAIGKISQLGFGVMAPGQAVTNLMTANVAGGAAGQSADLLNDLKAGHEVGANVGRQIVAQCVGILTGSLVGSWVYLQIIPDPAAQLLTPEWPAPAVATWKAVAEALSGGLSGIPDSAVIAMAVAAPLGVVLALLEHRLPTRALTWLPSGASLGLAFVVPASTSITLFLGALIGATLARLAPHWAGRFLLSVAAGLVAGESLFGVVSVWF
ncbi:MAG: OPT family oligopeptide transporter, partial [Myxococcales bacterium]|nr:OPT family oligopeptide transporter [Myxococcales bacterium]